MSLMTLPAVVSLRNFLRLTGIVKVVQAFRPKGGYEETVGLALEKYLRAGDVVWDIGANVGLYTKIFAITVGPAGNVFAFEPSPRNLTRLRAACATLLNVTILPVGLSSDTARAEFIQGDDDIGATSRIAGSGERSTGEAIEVELIRGDDLVESSTAIVPNVIKIDVEGHEYEVLEGLSTTIKNSALRAVVIEVHFGLLQKAKRSDVPGLIEKLLRNAGLKVRWIGASHLLAERTRS
jgi:FkbM family methyltransferase